MKVDKDVCVRCGGCVSVCPFDAIEATDGFVRANERCTDCGICERSRRQASHRDPLPMGTLGMTVAAAN